jgi:hypothetical protein
MTDRTQQFIFSLRGPRKGYVKTDCHSKFDLRKSVLPGTAQQEIRGGRLQCGACARRFAGPSASLYRNAVNRSPRDIVEEFPPA